MQRFFRFTLVLGGASLLSLITALGLTHGNRGPTQSIVVEQRQSAPGGSSTLALVVPGSDDPYIFTPDMSSVTYYGLTSDGTWILYVGSGETLGSIYGGLYHTRGLLPDSHLTAERVGDVHVMDTGVTGEWLVYDSWNDLYISRFDGTEQQNIRSMMPSGTWPDIHHGVAVSAESNSVLFTGEGGDASFGGYGPGGHSHSIYRVKVGVGEVENVSESLGGRINPVAWLDEHNWVVIQRDGGLYWKPSVGGEMTPLLDNPANALGYLAWFSAAGVLMVEGDAVNENGDLHTYYGFRPGETTPLWTISSAEGSLYDVTPDQAWIIFSRLDGHLERMHPDGREREILSDLPDDFYYSPQRGGISPDGEWILGWLSGAEGGSQVYRLHLATGHSEKLLETRGHVLETAWSPDGEWVLITDTTGRDEFALPRVSVVRVQTGEVTQVAEEGQMTRFAGWGPIVGKHWSAGLLMVVVAGLCVLGLMRRPPRIPKDN